MPLSRRQKGKKILGRLRLGSLVAGALADFQRTLDGGEQNFLIEWLFDEIERTALHGAHGKRNVAVAGYDDDREAVPSWGVFEVFDGQWRCRAGYHRVGSVCVPATAPPHAAYVAGSERWECEWGFQKIAAHCEEIKPPPHAYINASGRDWVCYPGFERKADQCVATSSPEPSGK